MPFVRPVFQGAQGTRWAPRCGWTLRDFFKRKINGEEEAEHPGKSGNDFFQHLQLQYSSRHTLTTLLTLAGPADRRAAL